MYESNPRMPIPLPRATPGDLTRIKSRVGGNLTFVQVPVPRAFDTMKETSQHLVYPNNMHQYHSRQQCKGLFSILFCNHVSSVKYRKQEQILKILDTMNRRSQFYNVLNTSSKGLHRDSQLERPLLKFFLVASSYKTNLARRSKILIFLRTKQGTFYEGFVSLPIVEA